MFAIWCVSDWLVTQPVMVIASSITPTRQSVLLSPRPRESLSTIHSPNSAAASESGTTNALRCAMRALLDNASVFSFASSVRFSGSTLSMTSPPGSSPEEQQREKSALR